MSYTVTIEVSWQPDKPGGFYTAVAEIEWQDPAVLPDGPVWHARYTTAQHSYSRARAISYALTEAALAFERGEIP